MAEFLGFVIPMFFLASSTIGLVWIQFVKSNLRIVTAEAAFRASQADTTISEVENFLIERIDERLGVPVAGIDVSLGQGLAAVELSIETFDLIGVGSIFAPIISVRTHGALEI